MSELPKGWVETPLFTIGEIVTGNTPSRKQLDYYGTDIPWAKPSDLMVKEPLVKTDEYLSKVGGDVARVVPKGSVLVSCIGNLGKVAIAGTELATNQQINSVVFNESIVLPRYGYYFLHTAKPWMDANASATTIAILNKGRFGQLPVRIAPLNEQKRIVAKLDELLPKVEACKERLQKIPAILKRFRQSVLAAAVSGKLTEEWRKQNTTSELGELLAQFEQRRGKRKASVGEVPESIELPTTWKWVSLDQICEVITDGDHQPPPQTDKGVPFIVISNIRSGRIDLSDTRFVAEEYYDQIDQKRRPKLGDILYSVVGSFGIPAPVETNERFVFQRHVALFRAYSEINRDFLLTALQSGLVFNQARAVATGSAQLTVPLSGLRSIMIGLPPIEEQAAIADAVASKLETFDVLVSKVSSANRFIDKTASALLGRAFSGNLVSQDPSEEPASLLLERIKSSAPSPKQKKATSGKLKAAKEPQSLSA